MSATGQEFDNVDYYHIASSVIESQCQDLFLPEKVVVPDVLVAHSLFPGLPLGSVLSLSLISDWQSLRIPVLT